MTRNGEPIFASAPGVVTDITYLDHSMLTHSDLFTISVRPNADSAYWMEYRNLKNLQVAEGDSVKAGQILAKAGDYFDASVGLVSFGVRRQQELSQRLCPTRFTTPEVESLYRAGLDTSNPAWPQYPHDDLCTSTSLLCTGAKCEVPADFVARDGDIDEGRRIYKEGCALCHGSKGEGGVAVKLCSGPSCKCTSCASHQTLAARIGKDMPPKATVTPGAQPTSRPSSCTSLPRPNRAPRTGSASPSPPSRSRSGSTAASPRGCPRRARCGSCNARP